MGSVRSSEGIDIAVHDLGGSGVPVLAAHATGFHGRAWGPLADRLTSAHVVAPDFRGHGDSVTPVGYAFDWARFGDDVLDTLDGLGWVDGSAVGIGHSMGAAALLLAELRRPGTFAGLWLYEPITFPPEVRDLLSGPENPLAAGARRRRTTFPSLQATIDTYGAKPPMNAFTPASLDAYVRGGFTEAADGTATLKCRPADEAVMYSQAVTCDAFERLAGVSCPTAVLRGALEEFGPSTIAPSVAAGAPAARLEVHDDLGHFGPMQDLEAMATSIEALLAEVSGSGQ